MRTSMRVAITGVGVVNAGIVGDSAALGAFLAAPRPAPGVGAGGVARVPSSALAGAIDVAEARRLSRVCQLSIAAAKLAVAESGVHAGLVVGTEFGDLASTHVFADGFLERGPSGLSPLLFPNTVMNTMAATTAIAVGARELALTLNAPTVAGELAVARAAAAIASGQAPAVLAGGVDEIDPVVERALPALGFAADRLGEGAAFLMLEAYEIAQARGATILGQVAAAAWRSLPARPWGVGRRRRSRAIHTVLERAGIDAAHLGAVYSSASGDRRRDAWEAAVLAAALGPEAPPAATLARLLGRHAGLGVLRVAAAAWTARSGLLPAATEPSTVMTRVWPRPGLVHGLGRGGAHVALVVAGA